MNRLTIAIPSKGRLKDQAETWLRSAGFSLRQKGGARGYSAELGGLPEAEILLLSAREIAEGLISGEFHVGITGEDLLHDLSNDPVSDVHTLRRLEFGGANVVVAVPANWLDVDTMSDLEAAGALFRERHGRRLRVATKYLRLTRNFFAARSVGEYRLVESAGATEAAPASGSAELIVDITSTGATLKANGLKVLKDGVILESQAVLAASLKTSWSEACLSALRKFSDGVEAAAAAASLSQLLCSEVISEESLQRFGLKRISARVALCFTAEANETARLLSQAGAGTVIITAVEQIYQSDNAVFGEFVKKVS